VKLLFDYLSVYVITIHQRYRLTDGRHSIAVYCATHVRACFMR